MPVPIPYVHAGIGLLLAVCSVPLILGRVPMNRGYGIRVRKAMVSEANWQAINRFGGVVFLVVGLLLVVFGYVSAGMAPPPRSLWAPAFLVVPLLVGGILVALLIGVYAGTLPDK
ncbi:MAG TPA: SdpI family protein [Terracidiphilus sp.]|nr:SdpI family protein [Terracidiphilus sp.]